MRRIAPLVIGIITTILILAAAAVPTAAQAAGPGPASDRPRFDRHRDPPARRHGRCVRDQRRTRRRLVLPRRHPGPGHPPRDRGIPRAGHPTANTGTLAFTPGGPLWFADRANSRIGSIDRSGHIRTYDIPHPDGAIAVPQGIVIGPGHYVWFTDQTGGTIDRLNIRTGAIDVHPVPTPASGPLGLVRGPDGALWFTERTAAKVGRMAPDGTFTEWALAPGAFPNRITVGPDRAIWFTELNAGKLGRIDRAGQLTEYPISGGPVGITTGPGHACS